MKKEDFETKTIENILVEVSFNGKYKIPMSNMLKMAIFLLFHIFFTFLMKFHSFHH